METIFFRDLIVWGNHGITTVEQSVSQPFRISLEVELDTTKSSQTDALTDTFDYRSALEIITNIIKGPSVKLIETLAHTIVDAVLASDTRLNRVTVTLSKERIFESGVPGIVVSKTH